MSEIPMPRQEAQKSVEVPTQKPITFYVGESKRLSTHIVDVLSQQEFFDRDPQDFDPSIEWDPVTVASQEDQKQWVDLRNQWLKAAWTPNQASEERTENSQRMNQLKKQMSALEEKATRQEQAENK